jgi:hypothetical protein
MRITCLLSSLSTISALANLAYGTTTSNENLSTAARTT